jgi:cytoskeleton protein RodZ
MPDASHDFGAHLRQAREQRGVSLREIAARTKISVIALEALERNDVSRLPGGIFTRAFVRAYAQEVGLDAEDTVRRFLARFPDDSTEEGPRHYEPNPDHIEVDEPPTFGRAWRAVAWSVPLLLVVGYFGFGGRLPWWRERAMPPAQKAAEPPSPSPVAAPPASAAQEATQPPPSSESQPSTTPPAGAEAPAVPAAAGQAGALPVSPAMPVSIPAAGAAVKAAAPGPTAPAATDPLPPGGFRLTLAPREACWVSIRVDGASVFSGLMRPGERKDLALHGDVSLTVGNAGAFSYFINEQPGRSLGGPGQVATARLTADNLKTFLEGR